MDEATERQVEALPTEGRTGRSRTWVLVPLLAGAVVVACGAYWFATRHRVTADNAYVKADSATVSSRVSGTVLRVQVEDDLPVEAGQVLLELDPGDYRAVVDKAEAVLKEAEVEVQAADLAVAATDARTGALVVSAEAAHKAALAKEREIRERRREVERRKAGLAADRTRTERGTVRYESDYKRGSGWERRRGANRTGLPEAGTDVAATDAPMSATEASIAAAGQEIVRTAARLEAARSERRDVELEKNRLEVLRAKRDRARAELETARLNLSHCMVRAPISGYVARKNVQVGDRLQPGVAVMVVVPLREVYVEANVKESGLTGVRPGQPVAIRTDIYPGVTFTGRVAGIGAGTEAFLAPLSSENATGNWFKTARRIPVRIALDSPPPADHPLRVGTSLEVTIDTRDRSGGALIPPSVPGGAAPTSTP